MIIDKERRRIANKLREAASAKGKRSGSMELMLSKLLGIAKRERGVLGQQVTVAATWRDVYRSLADLIDCPTCRNLGGEEGTNGEHHDFFCSACGYAADVTEPNYYPNCRAEVVDE